MKQKQISGLKRRLEFLRGKIPTPRRTDEIARIIAQLRAAGVRVDD